MFVTYTHVDDIKSRAKKWQVQSYQNRRRHELKETPSAKSRITRGERSKVGQRQKAPQQAAKSETALTDSNYDDFAQDDALQLFFEDEPPIRTAVGSLRRDQFNSWPMEDTGPVQLAMDYCECDP